jgi:hypothetical protein
LDFESGKEFYWQYDKFEIAFQRHREDDGSWLHYYAPTLEDVKFLDVAKVAKVAKSVQRQIDNKQLWTIKDELQRITVALKMSRFKQAYAGKNGKAYLF